MVADEKIRAEIQERVEKVPQEKLETLLEFVKTLEEGGKESSLLDYFGLWEDMDQDTLNELTTHLHERRMIRIKVTNS